MSLDDEPPWKDTIYLNFSEVPLEKLANELHFYLLKCEVNIDLRILLYLILLVNPCKTHS